ncbi:MAG: porphobilinogen synthase [Gemmatimonadota bacterium]|nr:porphobilinogen synthase [Gemmatimonadota bacterium]
MSDSTTSETAGSETPPGTPAAGEAVAPDPAHRLRRLRRTPALRSLVAETRLDPARWLCPLFVLPGDGVREPIGSMPGQERLSVDTLVEDAREIASLGIGGVLLFGIPESKDAVGTGAYAEDGIVQRAIRALKSDGYEGVIAADVCLCEYTDHGHCGVLEDGDVVNDETLPLLAATAVSLARAGADLIAPSAMMDGQVGAIRDGLDDAGFGAVPILSYAAKYASAFYGPFRDAADSAPSKGDRRGYQMDPPNAREAMREIESDLAEGADMIMVKPALPYLDVIRAAAEAFDAPLAAYHVSGEYAMLHAAAERGWLDLERTALESMTSIARAGAEIQITYFARDAARWLS